MYLDYCFSCKPHHGDSFAEQIEIKADDTQQLYWSSNGKYVWISFPIEQMTQVSSALPAGMTKDKLHQLIEGDMRYLSWEQRYLQRRFHPEDYLSQIREERRKKFEKEKAKHIEASDEDAVNLDGILQKEEEHDIELQDRFETFVLEHNGQRPLLALVPWYKTTPSILLAHALTSHAVTLCIARTWTTRWFMSASFPRRCGSVISALTLHRRAWKRTTPK